MEDADAKDGQAAASTTRRGLLRLPNGWTSLEAAKLFVEVLKGVAFPLALAYVGLEVGRAKQADEGLVKRRLQSLDAVAPAANDILCFVTVIGDWRSLDPQKIIERKRLIDREMWTYLGIWSPEVWAGYQAFMHVVFREYGGGAARPATIYGDVRRLRTEMGDHFQDASWVDHFEEPPAKWSPRAVRESYEAWMRAMRRDIGAAAS